MRPQLLVSFGVTSMREVSGETRSVGDEFCAMTGTAALVEILLDAINLTRDYEREKLQLRRIAASATMHPPRTMPRESEMDFARPLRREPMVSLQAALVAMALSGSGQTVMLDFYADWCAPCRAMGPTIDALAAKGYPVRRVNIDQQHDLAVRFGVTSIPCFVMLVNGREVDRVAQSTSYSRLERMCQMGANAARGELDHSSAEQSGQAILSQNPPATECAQPTQPKATAPAEGGADLSDAGQTVMLDFFADWSSPCRTMEPTIDALLSKGYPVRRVNVDRDRAVATRFGVTSVPCCLMLVSGVEADRVVGSTTYDRLERMCLMGEKVSETELMAASVRLRVEDRGGRSCGSGTIIDSRDGEALVATCGHLFREYDGKGAINVDLFNSGSPQTVKDD